MLSDKSFCVFAETFPSELHRWPSVLYEGLKDLGHVIIHDKATIPDVFDIGIWHGGKKNFLRVNLYKHFGGQKLITESPVFRIGASHSDYHFKYLRLGWNSFLADDAIFAQPSIESKRWQKISQDLGIHLYDWRKSGDHILLCLQKPRDASLRGKNVRHFLNEACLEIRQHTDRPIIVRPHPLDQKYLRKFEEDTVNLNARLKNISISIGKSLFEDMRNCWCTVSYSSLSSIDSIIYGCPSIACNSGSFVHEVTKQTLADIENPKIFDREPWLERLSHTQFDYDEIKSGYAFSVIFDQFENLDEPRDNIKRIQEVGIVLDHVGRRDHRSPPTLNHKVHDQKVIEDRLRRVEARKLAIKEKREALLLENKFHSASLHGIADERRQQRLDEIKNRRAKILEKRTYRT